MIKRLDKILTHPEPDEVMPAGWQYSDISDAKENFSGKLHVARHFRRVCLEIEDANQDLLLVLSERAEFGSVPSATFHLRSEIRVRSTFFFVHYMLIMPSGNNGSGRSGL